MPLDHVQFRTRWGAEKWCEEQNSAPPNTPGNYWGGAHVEPELLETEYTFMDCIKEHIRACIQVFTGPTGKRRA